MVAWYPGRAGTASIGLDTEVESATFEPLMVNLGWYWD